MSEDGVLVESDSIPDPEPVLASEPIDESEGRFVLSEEAPEPIEVESDDVDDSVVDVLAKAGTAIAATTSDVQINFFIKPP